MKRIYTTIICLATLVYTSVSSFAQNVEFSVKNFPDNKAEVKTALKQIDEGDAYYEIGSYQIALDNYLKAQAFNPNNADLNYSIGKCYFAMDAKDKSIPYLLKAAELDQVNAGQAFYALGLAYQATYQFDEAISAFQKASARLTNEEKRELGADISRHMDQCNNGKELMADTVRAFIDNMGSAINTKYREYSPIVSADNSMLIFTSTRENPYNKKPEYDDGEYDENIWVSYRDGATWSQAKEIGSPLNTEGHDATIGLSADGQQIFTYYGQKGGDIKYSKKAGDKWSVPTLFKEINSPAHECSASFSFDGNTVYFTSSNTEKVDNYGLHDIFMCKKDEKGKWGKPINLGPVVNTEYDEISVFMHPDGRTLYFVSDGHKTMGGYDIFKTEMQDDGTWSEPQNVGYPINTPDDDMYFTIGGSGTLAYCASMRDGGFGGLDIYQVTFLGPEKKLNMTTENNLIAAVANPIQQEVAMEKSVEIKTARLTIVKGTVSDAFEEPTKYLDALIEITDNETGKILFTNNANATTGKFLIPLPSGKNYGIAVKKDGYLFHSENFDVPQTSEYQEIVLDIKLMPIKKDSKIVLRNVFFDTDKSTLKAMSYAELDNLVKIMTENPKIKIEIGGHTDNVGTKTYNQKLSQARAESVVNYLISKKISQDRLSYKGYAYDEPVATNDTPEGRALNRRVEFKIVSNE